MKFDKLNTYLIGIFTYKQYIIYYQAPFGIILLKGNSCTTIQ